MRILSADELRAASQIARRRRRLCVAAGLTALLCCGCASSGRSSARPATRMPAVTTVTTSTAPASSLHFVRAPIVTFARGTPDPVHNVNYTVFVRVNRALRTVSGAHPILQLDGTSEFPLPVSRTPHCYQIGVGGEDNAQGAPQLLEPAVGMTVTVTLRRHHQELDRAQVALRAAPGFGSKVDAGYLHELGCPVKVDPRP